MYLCPIHKIIMQVSHEDLNLLGTTTTVKVASCPKCKDKYIGKKLFASTSTVTIKKTRYHYLMCLDESNENVEKNNTIAKPTPNPIKKMKNTTAEALEKYKLLKEKDEARKAEYNKKKALEQQEAAERKEKMIKDTTERIKSNRYAAYHAKQIVFKYTSLQRCEFDNEELIFVERVKVNHNEKEVLTSGYCCLRCGRVYITDKEKQKIKQTTIKKKNRLKTDERQSQYESILERREALKNQSATSNISQKNSLNESIDFGYKNNILYICKGTISCKNKNHDIESVTGIIENKYGLTVKINANYCRQCNKYFIDYAEYSHYRKLYGTIMGNFRISNNGNFGGLFKNLSQESILHLCGYTVNQSEDLSKSQRRHILEFLINRGIQNKSDIISHLNFLIKTNEKKHNMSVAISRWNDDIDWVRNYQIDSQQRFMISEIKNVR